MFRFKIRDLIWLTVGVALVLAWGLDRTRLTSQGKRLMLDNKAIAE